MKQPPGPAMAMPAKLTIRCVYQHPQVQECMRQFPLIVNEGRAPDYDTCIKISTAASLKEMIAYASFFWVISSQ